jgi:hypothetical protein
MFLVALLLDAFLRVSLTPVVSFAPVTLKANISIKDGRKVRAELDCDNGYYSSSSWDRDDRPHQLTFKITSGGNCTLTIEVKDQMGKVIGFTTVQATVIGRE